MSLWFLSGLMMIKHNTTITLRAVPAALSSHLSHSSHLRSSAGVYDEAEVDRIRSQSPRSLPAGCRKRACHAHGALYLADHCTQGHQPRRSSHARRQRRDFQALPKHRAYLLVLGFNKEDRYLSIYRSTYRLPFLKSLCPCCHLLPTHVHNRSRRAAAACAHEPLEREWASARLVHA